MLKLLLNAFLAGLIIAVVSVLVRRSPRLASLVLTMPIVIPAVFAVSYLNDRNLTPISRSAREMLMLIPLALPFFLPLAFAERLGLSFWPAMAGGFALVALGVGAYLWWT